MVGTTPKAKLTKGALLALGAMLFAPLGACARSSVDGGSFLPLGHGAKVFGQGGSSIALLDDDGAAYWNPAKLPFLNGSSMTLGHSNLISGVKIGYSSVSLGRALGSKVSAFDSEPRPGDPRRHALAFFFSHLGLELSQGSHWSENVLAVSYGVAVVNYATFGASFKLLTSRSELADSGALGVSLDLGLHYVLTERADLAIVIKDLAGGVSWDTDTEERLPITTTVGIAYTHSRPVAAELDLVLQDDLIRGYGVGGCADLVGGRLQLRSGVSVLAHGEKRVGPASGFGILYKTFGFDYAARFDASDALGSAHCFALRVAL